MVSMIFLRIPISNRRGDAIRAWPRGALHDLLRTESPVLAAGFNVAELDRVFAEMDALRARMLRRG